MSSAVPATGIVNNPATIATPAHRALELGKHFPLRSQQASSNRKIEIRCHKKSPASVGKWVTRSENATRLGHSVSCACEAKNSVHVGNNSGRRIFSTPGK